MRFTGIFLLLFVGVVGLCKEPIIQRYDVKDGLPSSFIYDVIQDDNGLIWIATDKGISRFDGSKFKNYTVKNRLPSNDVFGFVKDGNGDIWLDTHDKIAVIKDQSIVVMPNHDDLAIHQHYFDRLGTHFLSNMSGYNTFILDDEIELIPLNPTNRIFLEYHSENEFTYFESIIDLAKGISLRSIKEVENKTIVSSSLEPMSMNQPTLLKEWVQDRYVVIGHYGLEIFKNKILSVIPFRRLGFEDELTEAYSVDDGVFLKSRSKVLFYDLETEEIKDYSFLLEIELHDIYRDSERNLWLPTDNGLFFVSQLSLKSESFYLGYQERSSNETATKIIEDAKGDILVATYEGNIYKYLNGSLELIISTGLEGLRDMIQDSYGRLWLATDQFGCFRLMNLDYVNDPKYHYHLKGIENIQTDSEIAIFRTIVKSLNMGPDNRLYIASAYGVSRVDFESGYFNVTKLDSIRSYSVAQDLYGYIWIGRTSGISRYKDGNLIDLGPSHPISNLSVTDIDVDDSNGLWIGSDGFGLFHDRGTVLCQIEELDGYIIKSLYIDDTNKIWAATNRGVVGIRSTADSETECKYELNYISATHGLASDEVNDILIKDNYLFAATKNGVSKIPINANTSSENKSPLIFQSVQINNVDQFITDKYELSYDQNNLKIDFAALSYQSLGKIIYEYQMSRIDSTWNTTFDRFREYQTLQPGEYTFKIRAKDINGNILADEKQLVFNILEPWWNRWWFRLLYIALAILLLIAINRYQIRKARKEAEKENVINKKFAELEMQAIRSQMNPHFLFNALHSIQDFIFTNDSLEANRYISSFASLMRKILDASKEKYIYLDQELEMLRLYIDLEKLRFQDKFEYSEEIDEEIDHMRTEVPTLILQPVIENAINHGLIPREKDGALKLIIRKISTGIKIIIEDNGIGIEKSKEIKASSELKHESKGMKMITDRMELMNEMYNARIKFSYEDLDPTNETYPGTKVIIELPD